MPQMRPAFVIVVALIAACLTTETEEAVQALEKFTGSTDFVTVCTISGDTSTCCTDGICCICITDLGCFCR